MHFLQYSKSESILKQVLPKKSKYGIAIIQFEITLDSI